MFSLFLFSNNVVSHSLEPILKIQNRGLLCSMRNNGTGRFTALQQQRTLPRRFILPASTFKIVNSLVQTGVIFSNSMAIKWDGIARPVIIDERNKDLTMHQAFQVSAFRTRVAAHRKMRCSAGWIPFLTTKGAGRIDSFY